MTASLSRLLSEVREPVFVLDHKRTLIYVNGAMEKWLAVEGEAIVGRRCDYASSATADRVEQLAAAICPPPGVWEGNPEAAILEIPSEGGTVSRRAARFLPLGEDAVDCEGVLAVVSAEEYDPQAGGAPLDPQNEPRSLHLQLQRFRNTQAGKYKFDRLVGKSAQMLRVRRQAELAVESGARAVVIGQPGSGREHVARVIHFAGDDTLAPTLMPLACPLLDAELLQTSITAFARHAADNPTTRPATLLLCDADQLSNAAQNELFGFLALPGFDLHVLSTARRSLLDAAEAGTFRKELAFALSTLEIELPQLAARRRDIQLLAPLFLEAVNSQGRKQYSGFAADAMDALCEFSWEENLDELREVVAQACEAASGGEITREDLPSNILQTPTADRQRGKTEEPIVLDDVLADVESELIRRAMKRAKGNKTKAAELLGISRPRLHRRWDEMEGEA